MLSSMKISSLNSGIVVALIVGLYQARKTLVAIIWIAES